jgi:hypothetical protein
MKGGGANRLLLFYIKIMIKMDIDNSSAEGFLLSVTLIAFGKLTESITDVEVGEVLKNIAYTLSILVAIDTLLGGKIKKTIAKLWK